MNKPKVALLLLAMIFAISVMPPQKQRLIAPLLDNGGFEGSSCKATAFWTPAGGPFHYEFNEITTPEGWVTWWREGFPCSGTSDWVTGRPEVRVISGPDPARIHSGKQATQWFTLWRCSEGGLLQQVRVTPGQSYTARVYSHSWFSNCDHRPHDAPYDYDCETLIDWAHNFLSIGLDPEGGINPLASSVVWSREYEIYGIYGEALEIPNVVAQTMTMTVFIRSEATHPLKHVDLYHDEVTLIDCTHRIFLPVMVGRLE